MSKSASPPARATSQPTPRIASLSPGDAFARSRIVFFSKLREIPAGAGATSVGVGTLVSKLPKFNSP